ncbi:hypothetical protein FB451DRAFT_1561595 [Mycena latifolia]|nr:hypothetical protein FB451DRAFT_1561595 [Mycena latifolia]
MSHSPVDSNPVSSPSESDTAQDLPAQETESPTNVSRVASGAGDKAEPSKPQEAIPSATCVRPSSESLSTPRKAKPGSRPGSQANHKEGRNEDALPPKLVWKEMLHENFAGIIPITQFLKDYMPQPMDTERRTTIRDIQAASTATRPAAKEDVGNAEKGNGMSALLINYLQEVVSTFPEENKPLIVDTHSVSFESLDEHGRYTRPDITSSQPGMKEKPKKWAWPHAGTVIELKYKTDVFNDSDELNSSDDSRDALIQLAKSARSLLMASRSCVVYVIAVFARCMVRIFRFDRSGFRASSAFDWTEDDKFFPTFFWRLYNPENRSTRIYGGDETLSLPTREEKERMHAALFRNSFYKDYSLSDATADSLWIKAVRSRLGADGDVVSEPVTCFTIGPPLSISDGLFSRATLVYRVLLKEDADKENPTVYALKDAWRQQSRRPEIDFYDVIARHCELNNIDMDAKGMARCHGSVDLSVPGLIPNHDPALHTTSSNSAFERCHMRSLLTPIGRPLNCFTSTKSLVEALHTAVQHHEIAFNAGVLHRDVSEGNVLFAEAPEAGTEPKGFLVDWDYAEFTEDGLNNFIEWFKERAEASNNYNDIDKSLKNVTGTFPFMAIEIIANAATHGPHHDLESVYWLLIWMLLRHTKHNHIRGSLACGHLFDSPGDEMKRGWLQSTTPIENPTGPLYRLVEKLREGVYRQNPTKFAGPVDPDDSTDSDDGDVVPVVKQHLTYKKVLKIFSKKLKSTKWPQSDGALPFVVPSGDESKNKEAEGKAYKPPPALRKEALERSQGLKRGLPEDLEEDVAPSSSASGTIAASGSAGSAAKKAKISPAITNTAQEELTRRSKRLGAPKSSSATIIIPLSLDTSNTPNFTLPLLEPVFTVPAAFKSNDAYFIHLKAASGQSSRLVFVSLPTMRLRASWASRTSSRSAGDESPANDTGAGTEAFGDEIDEGNLWVARKGWMVSAPGAIRVYRIFWSLQMRSAMVKARQRQVTPRTAPTMMDVLERLAPPPGATVRLHKRPGVPQRRLSAQRPLASRRRVSTTITTTVILSDLKFILTESSLRVALQPSPRRASRCPTPMSTRPPSP